MPNPIEEALKRASPESQAKTAQFIQEARQNMPSVAMKDTQQISLETNVPGQAPANSKGLDSKQLDETPKENIDATLRSQGNNYLNKDEKTQANPIEDVLKRASPESQAKTEQFIQEARQNINTDNVKDASKDAERNPIEKALSRQATQENERSRPEPEKER